MSDLQNVAFYRRFGFETIRETSILGVPNFFMCRPVKITPDPVPNNDPAAKKLVAEDCIKPAP